MDHPIQNRIFRRELTRRDVLWLMAVTGASIAAPVLSGCAADPVTGESSLVGLSESDEIAIDRKQSPHQFSQDYGAVQDPALNRYLETVGASLDARTHRPKMPYSYRVLNANYVNAYTFPAGSVGVTRGILLELDDEAELAGLVGHELGHVNARHAAEQAGRTMVANAALAAAMIALATAERGSAYAPVAGVLGQVGASALLASYSRDDEREADSLGMEYMTRANYPAEGMTGLMGVLIREAKSEPSMLETMFSTHPMSAERFETAKREASTKYAKTAGLPGHRERYMDSTASLRRLAPAIREQQKGETVMAKKKLPEAETHFTQALKLAPEDYAGNVIMAKCLIAQRQPERANEYLSRARSVYPQEAQAMQLSALAKLALKQPEPAYAELVAYDKALPGNPNVAFMKGVCLENMRRREAAAQEYARYLRAVGQGQQAQYAAQRLRSWGYLR